MKRPTRDERVITAIVSLGQTLHHLRHFHLKRRLHQCQRALKQRIHRRIFK